MFYMFIKMSSGWFCKEVEDVKAASSDAMEYIEGGEVVAFSDDIEDFAGEIGIKEDEITIID